MNTDMRKLLEDVKNGSVSVDDALLKIKTEPFADIGFAKVDLHRKVRQGATEVIYGGGKTPEQILAISNTLLENGEKTILITRLSPESAALLQKDLPMIYHSDAKIGVVGTPKLPTALARSLLPPAAPATSPLQKKQL